MADKQVFGRRVAMAAIEGFENRRAAGFAKIGGKNVAFDGLISRGGYRRILPESGASESWLSYRRDRLLKIAPTLFRGRNATIFEGRVLARLDGRGPLRSTEELAKQLDITPNYVSVIESRVRAAAAKALDGYRDSGNYLRVDSVNFGTCGHSNIGGLTPHTPPFTFALRGDCGRLLGKQPSAIEIRCSSQHLGELLDKAITHTALRVVTSTSDELAARTAHDVAVFNSHAHNLDYIFGYRPDINPRKSGFGQFGLRAEHTSATSFQFHKLNPAAEWQSLAKLTYLTSLPEHDPVYDWMLLLIQMSHIPIQKIENEAFARNGRFRTTLQSLPATADLKAQLAARDEYLTQVVHLRNEMQDASDHRRESAAQRDDGPVITSPGMTVPPGAFSHGSTGNNHDEQDGSPRLTQSALSSARVGKSTAPLKPVNGGLRLALWELGMLDLLKASKS